MHYKFQLLFFLILISYSNLISLEIPKDLIVKTLEEGNDNKSLSNKNDYLSVNYTGWIFDKNSNKQNHCDAKGKMFDSNILEKFNHVRPFEFILGNGTVIKGWDIGLMQMKVNEKRCLVIPPELAYGNRRIGNIIRPNSTLIFEVKLIGNLKKDTQE